MITRLSSSRRWSGEQGYSACVTPYLKLCRFRISVPTACQPPSLSRNSHGVKEGELKICHPTLNWAFL